MTPRVGAPARPAGRILTSGFALFVVFVAHAHPLPAGLARPRQRAKLQ
jgi:hypothetical protein